MDKISLRKYKDTLHEGYFHVPGLSYFRRKDAHGTWSTTYIKTYRGYLNINDELFDNFVPTKDWLDWALPQAIPTLDEDNEDDEGEILNQERLIYILALLLESGASALLEYYFSQKVKYNMDFSQYFQNPIEGEERTLAQDRLVNIIFKLIETGQDYPLTVIQAFISPLFLRDLVGEDSDDINNFHELMLQYATEYPVIFKIFYPLIEGYYHGDAFIAKVLEREYEEKSIDLINYIVDYDYKRNNDKRLVRGLKLLSIASLIEPDEQINIENLKYLVENFKWRKSRATRISRPDIASYLIHNNHIDESDDNITQVRGLAKLYCVVLSYSI